MKLKITFFPANFFDTAVRIRHENAINFVIILIVIIIYFFFCIRQSVFKNLKVLV